MVRGKGVERAEGEKAMDLRRENEEQIRVKTHVERQRKENGGCVSLEAKG